MDDACPNVGFLLLATALVGCGVPSGGDRSSADGPLLGAPPASPPTQPTGTDAGSNVRVNQDASGEDQNETAVAVHPTNPLNIVAAARDRRNGIERNGFFSSLDGGATWTDGILTEGTYAYQSDPVVAACANGSFVYATLSFNSGGGNGIFAYRSTDGGRTWPQKSTVVTGTSLDKEWIACDAQATSPFKAVVTVPLDERLTENKDIKLVYAIGPAIMMKFVCITTAKHKVKTIVSLNSIMVDATGMCGACRVEVGGKTKFACVDGPEFDGHAVDFDLLMSRQRMYTGEEKEAMELYKITTGDK